MDSLSRALAALTVLMILCAACSTLVPQGSAGKTIDRDDGRGSPIRVAKQPFAEKSDLLQTELPLPSDLDLEHWPFGWVIEEESALRLGISGRFWSDHKLLWTLALKSEGSIPTSVRRLEEIYRKSGEAEEAFRASWLLWQLYAKAGLSEEARSWLDRAHTLRPSSVTSLDRAWDQEFRLRDSQGARALLTAGPWPTAGDLRKSKLLRQHLFLGTKSLLEVGADDFVSTIALDRDDLWAGTWNGAVVRWSLATGSLDLIQASGSTVAPVKLLTTTRWFVYAFQEQNLLRYSKVTGTWRSFPYPKGWTGLRVQAVVPREEQSLWVATLGEGLWEWNSGDWTAVGEGRAGPFLNALDSDGRGGLWVGTKDRGLWHWNGDEWALVPSEAGVASPSNISVLQASPDGLSWAVGTWGEGAWILENGRLRRASAGNEYVTSAAWDKRMPLWGTLDEGLVSEGGISEIGPLDGLPAGGVGSLVVWQGRWVWGTSGQGLGWWSENEDSALLR